jgi:hypothetical protein
MRIRSNRIKDFIQDESIRGVQLQHERFIEKENNEWIAKFTIINNGNETINLSESNPFNKFILDNSRVSINLCIFYFYLNHNKNFVINDIKKMK